MSQHADVFLVLGALAVILAFIEVRLRALFLRHETREERMHADSQLRADGAAAAAKENARHIHELRVDVTEQRIDLGNLGEMVRLQGSRLEAVETRVGRAAMTVPRREPPEDP